MRRLDGWIALNGRRELDNLIARSHALISGMEFEFKEHSSYLICVVWGERDSTENPSKSTHHQPASVHWPNVKRNQCHTGKLDQMSPSLTDQPALLWTLNEALAKVDHSTLGVQSSSVNGRRAQSMTDARSKHTI